MRITKEQLAAEQENRRKEEAGEWFPTRQRDMTKGYR